jgi:hypothetical protein
MKRFVLLSINQFCAIVVFIFACSIHLFSQSGTPLDLPQFLYPEFLNSRVLFKAGMDTTLMINYNTASEKMVFIQNQQLYDLVNPESVDTIYLQNCKFVPVGNTFYEVVVNRHLPFFIQHKSDLIFRSKPAPSMTAQTSESNYFPIVDVSIVYLNFKLPAGYRVKSSLVYWVRVKGNFSSFSSEKQLLKLFPVQENQIKKFIKDSGLKIKTRMDLIKLGNYCNDLINQ